MWPLVLSISLDFQYLHKWEERNYSKNTAAKPLSHQT